MSLKFLTDENFNGHIWHGLKNARPTSDIVRVQDIGLSGADDPAVLGAASLLGRVLLTHDATTIPDFAYERLEAGVTMSGVLIVRRSLPVKNAILAVLLFIDLAEQKDSEGQIYYLPL